MPKVSVIIPTYNRVHLVGNAIQSVLNQNFQDFEIIVVDDGSTDNTAEMVARFAGKVIYIRQEHKERSAARNNGMKHACGQYITFLDSDDLFLPEKLHVQVESMEKNPDYGMSYSYSVWLDENGKYLHTWKGSLEGWVYPDIMKVKNTKLTTPSVMIRKSILERIGYFNEHISTCEDYEFWCRIARHYPVLLIKQSLVIINTNTNGLRDPFNVYFKGNLLYYQSVFNSDNSIKRIKKQILCFDLFIKYYLNSTCTENRKNVLSVASDFSIWFPIKLKMIRFFAIITKSINRYNGLFTILRFVKNYILVHLPSTISLEDMEYGILRNVLDNDQLLLIKKHYKKNESNSDYTIIRDVERQNRKIIRGIFINCKYMSSNRIAKLFNIY